MWEALKEFWVELDEPLFTNYWTVKRVIGIALAVLFVLVFLIGPHESQAANGISIRTIVFNDATATLDVVPCELPSLKDDTAFRGGKVVFTDGRPMRKLCWFEADDAILLIDETGRGGIVPADIAEPTGIRS